MFGNFLLEASKTEKQDKNSFKFQLIRKKKIYQHFQSFAKFLLSFISPSNEPQSNKKCATIAKLILKIVIWIVLYLFGGYFTVTTSYDLISQYVNNPTQFQVTNLMNITEMNLPDYTICYPIKLTTEKADFSYSDAINAFFYNNTKDGIFSVDPKATFSGEVYNVVWIYLATIYEFESLREGDQNPFQRFNQVKENDWSGALINIFVPNVALLNIKIEQLKAVFDGILSQNTIPFFVTMKEKLSI